MVGTAYAIQKRRLDERRQRLATVVAVMAGGTARQKWDFASRLDTARAAQAEADAAWLRVCRAVDLRDRRTCRCCGTRADPSAIGLLKRAHRHHIMYRSAGGPDTTANLITLCATCHSAEHQHRLDIRGNADTSVEFWRRAWTDGPWILVKREP